MKKKELASLTLTTLLISNMITIPPSVKADTTAPNHSQANIPQSVTPTSSAPSGTDIASGTFGTSQWTLDASGTLRIGGGTFADTGGNNPWKTYQAQIKTIVFDASVTTGTDASYLFTGMHNLTSIENLNKLNTSQMTNMSHMFYDSSSLTNLDLSSFDTSKVTNMYSLFDGCSSLTSLDVSKFDTSNVTDMRYMFYDCSNVTSLDVSSFDTSKVTDMGSMFRACNVLTSLDVSKFDTSNVTDMSWMFTSCSILTSLDVSSFDTSKVTTMYVMFDECSSLTSLDVSKFNTSNVTNMGYMFEACSSLTSLDVSKFNTSNVTDMSWMFEACSSLTSLDVSKFNTSNVTDMKYMFKGCSSLNSLDISSFDTSKVTDFGGIFEGTEGLNSFTAPPTFPKEHIPDVNHLIVGQSETKLHDSTIYVGDKWKAQDNFDSAKDKAGKALTFAGMKVIGTVVTSKPGVYTVHYQHDGLGATAKVTVKANQKAIKVHDSTIYVGDKWSAQNNFDSAKDKAGKALAFADMTVTGTVNTSKVGVYTVHYKYDGLDVTAKVTVKAKATPGDNIQYQVVYRLYNKNTGEHFYTMSAFEKNSLVKGGWNYEGLGWSAPNKGTAVYRVYNPNAKGGDHYYTASQYEAQSLVKTGWKWDNGGKPVFYSGGKTPVYVAFNPNATASGSHNYTSSSFEQQSLLKNGWKFGKVQFYGK